MSRLNHDRPMYTQTEKEPQSFALADIDYDNKWRTRGVKTFTKQEIAAYSRQLKKQ